MFNEDKKGPLVKPGPRRTPEGVAIEIYRQPAPIAPVIDHGIDNILDLIDGFQNQNRADTGSPNRAADDGLLNQADVEQRFITSSRISWHISPPRESGAEGI